MRFPSSSSGVFSAIPCSDYKVALLKPRTEQGIPLLLRSTQDTARKGLHAPSWTDYLQTISLTFVRPPGQETLVPICAIQRAGVALSYQQHYMNLNPANQARICVKDLSATPPCQPAQSVQQGHGKFPATP